MDAKFDGYKLSLKEFELFGQLVETFLKHNYESGRIKKNHSIRMEIILMLFTMMQIWLRVENKRPYVGRNDIEVCQIGV